MARRTPWRWLRRLILLSLLAAIVLSLIALGLRAYFVHDSEQELANAEAEADRLDPGWRWEELLAKRAVVPDETNSALKVLAAAAKLPKDWPKKPFDPRDDEQVQRWMHGEETTIVDQINALEPNEPLDEATVSALREELRRIAPALTEARGLAQMRQGRYAVAWKKDLLATLIPHIPQARTVADMLRLQATLQGHDRDLADSMESCAAALIVGRSLGDEPMLISVLARDACALTAVGGIERLLAQGHVSDEMLVQLQNLLNSEANEGQTSLLRAMRGERGAWHQLGNAVQTGEDLKGGELEHLRSDSLNFWLYININLRYGQALALELANETVEIAKLPLQKQREKWLQLDAKFRAIERTPRTGFALLQMPAVVKIYDAHAKTNAALQCASAAIAVERYRMAYRQWPENLETLMPRFLSAIPVDPFIEESLRYRRTEDGAVVYSVGRDGQDDGGNLHRTKPGDKGPPPDGTDIGFRLWDPDKRRQPAKAKTPEEKAP